MASQVAEATKHLRRALAAVDALLARNGPGSNEQAAYHLGEASRAIHCGLLSLAECVELAETTEP